MRTTRIDPNAKTGVLSSRNASSTGLYRRAMASSAHPAASAPTRDLPHITRSGIRRLGDLEINDSDDVVTRRDAAGDRRRVYETGFMDGGECILAYDPSGRLASALRFHDDD